MTRERDVSRPSTPPPVPVTVTPVEERDIPTIIRAVGSVRSNQSVDIRSQVDGLLVELLVNEGQRVIRGQLLARIDDQTIAANLQQARSQLAVTRSRLATAKTDLARYRSLAEDEAVSGQMLDQQASLVAELQATLAMHKAAVQADEVLLGYTRIQSPATGRVGIRNVDQGNFVRSSDAEGLFSVVQLDPISVEFALPQAQLPRLQELMSTSGQRPIPVLAYAADGGAQLAQGQLSVMDNRVSSQSGTIRLKAVFANAQGHLWPDQSVVVVVQSGVLAAARVIPPRAIQQGADSTRVWRVRDGKAESIEIGIRYADEQVAAVTGLDTGDVVIIDGQSRVRAGALVRPQAASAGASAPKRLASTVRGAR